jgi:hypothetical protein
MTRRVGPPGLVDPAGTTRDFSGHLKTCDGLGNHPLTRQLSCCPVYRAKVLKHACLKQQAALALTSARPSAGEGFVFRPCSAEIGGGTFFSDDSYSYAFTGAFQST